MAVRVTNRKCKKNTVAKKGYLYLLSDTTEKSLSEFLNKTAPDIDVLCEKV